ncbi:MAG: hypothetical protein OHK0045_01500 [Raineya sp.]
MEIKSLLSFLFLLAWQFLLAQNAQERLLIQQKSNLKELQILEKKFRAQEEYDRTEAYKIAQQKGLPIFKTLADGRIAELQYFMNGSPIYFVTNSNLQAAQTTRAHQLWTGGSLGLNLNGQDMIIGEWDGGAVRATHQEFGTGRIVQKDGAAFGGANTNTSHATHVAGTLMGVGTNSNAKGMAHQATLWANDWTNDLSEATNQATDGLLVSNHSYGYQTSSLQQWQFGYYDSNSANWDELAFNAPFYLPCIAAGNDRNAGVNTSAGGFDLITGRGLAKNVLTVGAVNIQTNYTGPSSVVMSSFSNWGPTDDGRIKPDVVGAGVGILSSVANSDDSYASYNGTSMATPNVAGSILLLQQHYKNLNSGNFMRAATLKALTIHTADEAGDAPGPDYRFGWGLVNVQKAAQIISANGTNAFIQERTLNNGSSATFQIVAASTDPIEVTIAWTDPKGTPAPTGVINPANLMLINDLDMRIWRNATERFMPWVLDPATPSAAAAKGDNFRDNVEKIIIDTPIPGATYTIEICHKRSLQGGSQNYSMIITGVSSFAVVGSITAPDAITAKFSQSIDEGVNNDQVTFSDASTKFTCSTPDITSWQWNFDVDGLGGVSPSTFSGKTPPPVTYANSGLYKIRLTVSNGSATSTSESEIQINLAKPTNLRIANLITNDAGVSYVMDQANLEWTDNSDETNFEVQRRQNVTGSVFQTIATLPANQTSFTDNTIQDSKEYAYRIQAVKGILTPATSNQVLIKTVVIASLSNSLSEQELSLYPNPTKEKVWVQVKNATALKNIKILDTKGRILVHQTDTNGEISLANIPKGLYLVYIETSEGGAVRKLLVE